MTIKEIYKKIESVGVLTASTISGDEVHSRMVHLNGYDNDGIYLRTMWNKPYGQQLINGKKITLCGLDDSRVLGHDEEGVPDFPPGYFVKLIGDVKHLSESEVRERAKTNDYLKLAVYDMDKYPAMKDGNFMIYRAKGEVYDHDFSLIKRDHKLLRTRFQFGGMPFNKVGPTITNRCSECSLCLENCSFKAIEVGNPYTIISERCDDCGSCIMNCPVDAIKLSEAI